MTTRVVFAIAVPLLIAVAAWLAPKVKARLAPTQPDEPGDDDREASDPEVHEGATEEWGKKLHALKNAPVAPELVSDTEMDLQWALVWHDCEHRWQAEVNRIFAEAQAELQRPRTFDEVRELVAA